VRDGRRVGGSLNIHDVSSVYCQQRTGVVLESLDQFDDQEECWREVLIEDRKAGPAEIARTRIDFAAWLRLLPGRLRKVAKFLAASESTTAAAQKFDVSAGPIARRADGGADPAGPADYRRLRSVHCRSL
jgi:hypothetical protein